MKKIFFCFLMTFFLAPKFGLAQSMVTEEKKTSKITVLYTSFADYEPIAYYYHPNAGYGYLKTIFTPALETIAQKAHWDIRDESFGNIEKTREAFHDGKADLFLGDYYEADEQRYVNYIYPAILNNPIRVMTLPKNMTKIKSTEDLKKLKGAYIATEHLSRYMLNNFKQYNILPLPDAYTAYEKLFTDEIDYIIGSYYYNYAQACLLGVKNEIAFTKDSLWNMPLFFLVSKKSVHAERIKRALSKYMTKPEFKAAVEKALRDQIQDFEIQGNNIVPPSFVRVQTKDDVTPAEGQN